ncbi:hypothetical protein [Streptomyces sp. enrichment culture]|uniref:hypothetical protein n=1 Tax=Streptomyces sp. enrichment culture TaxID=1795815 RepID=UPI003F553CFE
MHHARLEFAGSAPHPEAAASGLRVEDAVREAPSARRPSDDAERTTTLRLPKTPETGQGAVPSPRSAPDVEGTAVLPTVGETRALPETRAFPEAHVLPQAGVLPEARPLPEAHVLPETRAFPEVHVLPQAGVLPEVRPLPEAHVLPETRAFPEVHVLPQAGVLPEVRPLPEVHVLPETRAFPEAHVLPQAGVLPEARPLPGTRQPSPPLTAAGPGAPAEPDTPTVVRNPRQGAGAAEHTHDPHEVTVQLDAVQLGDGRLVRVAPEMPGGTPEGSDGPVFVDESGRRVRRFRRLGIAVGLACAAYAVAMVATLLSGSSEAPWLPVRDPKEQPPAGQADPAPLPSRPASPSASGAPAAEDPAPPATDAATPAPGPGTTAPGVVPALPQPDGTLAPEPAPARTAPGPGGSTTEPGPTGTSGQPSTGMPDLFPTQGGGLPTGPGRGRGNLPGGDTPAGGPNDRASRTMSAPAASAPSPEYLL